MSIFTDANRDCLRKISLATLPSEGVVVSWQAHKVEAIDSNTHNHCYFIPPHMQNHICSHCDDLPEYQTELYERHFHKAAEFRQTRVENTAHHRTFLFGNRLLSEARPHDGETIQQIYDARNHRSGLPGHLVKDMNDPKKTSSRDLSVNRAFDSTRKTYDFYYEVLKRDSIDGKGMQLRSTVHFDRNYGNAFWNGRQMVYGDGDGTIFADFTLDLDVTAHEITHGVTQHILNFEYVGQSGAINEHFSDVFGTLTKQYSLGQTVKEANWLIGDKILMGAGAIRSMKAPGKAYDTPLLGKDPQPARMGDYVHMPNDEENDNGGVHINSGILNRAFFLVARALGGHSWEKAGFIWYNTLFDRELHPNATFVDLANATIRSVTNLARANSDWNGKECDAVISAWKRVEVLDR